MRDDRWATPDSYAEGLDGQPVLSSEMGGWRSGLVRRWTGVSGEIRQPRIDHHYLVLHLGGRKHVTRRGGGRTVSAAVEEGALTLVRAGTRYDWTTVGPIDFAHLYVHPSRFGGLIASRFERDPSQVTLDESVGFEDRLLTQLMHEMLVQVGEASADAHAHLDALFELALVQLAHKHSTLGPPVRIARHALAPTRLRRVLDYLEAHIAVPVGVGDMAQVAGLSPFHFSRAFQSAMDTSPGAYLTGRRVEIAKRLLRMTETPVAEVGRLSGLGSPSAFAAIFRRRTGQTPSSYRRQL